MGSFVVARAAATTTTTTSLQLTLLLLCLLSAAAAADTSYKSRWCSEEKYAAGGPYARSVETMLLDLQAIAEFFPDVNGTLVVDGDGDGGGSIPCYGSRTCSYTDEWSFVAGCQSCFAEAVKQLRARCRPHRIGAQIKLKDCSVRYENVRFF
ncbi:unnamed protein product [Linum trigynum]|uniref:Gnk2-homologous domain-containing protein n=1 Tax=Linum trigynum TaxID=586398 RepID=A0AAV2EYZ0_9ROSI